MNPNSLIILLLSTFTLITTVTSDKILVLSFLSSNTHKITYMPLVEELAKRSHQITIISPIPATTKTQNIKEIFTYDIGSEEVMTQLNMFKMKETGEELSPSTMMELFGSICKKTYDLPQVKALLKESFDLIILEPVFNECALGLVHRLKAPWVIFFPVQVPGLMVSKMGGHFPSSYVPNCFLGFGDEMGFLQRMANFGMDVFLEGIFRRFLWENVMTEIYREKLGQDLPAVDEIYANASFMLSNGHFSVGGPRPYLPDVVEVGGIHTRPAGSLPKDLEDFISKSGKDGFIYFSMGSFIKGDQMTEAKRKMFIKVFSKLKQQVVWKWESETMPDLPKNVKLSKWLPQQDLLGHPNIKLFITQCGRISVDEAIYHGVPLVGLPFIGDQPTNAKQAKRQGFLVDLEWNELTEGKISYAVNEVLNNKKYSESVKRLSKVFIDQPDTPLQRGAYWVEYIMRHKGAPHLRSAARKLNYFQYHSWDVIAAYGLIIFIILRIIFAILRFVFRKICGSSEKNSKVVKKKNQ